MRINRTAPFISVCGALGVARRSASRDFEKAWMILKSGLERSRGSDTIQRNEKNFERNLPASSSPLTSPMVNCTASAPTSAIAMVGLLPRLHVVQTSAEGYGQIYLPAVNWLLMLVTLGLSIGFRSSSSLAAAYGVAVATTMLATTILLSIAMREIWRWPLPAVIVSGLGFAIVDGGFLCANLMKIARGGWVPLLFGALICGVMLIWRRGNAAV
jgi:KUP system potassium uptake protein